MTVRWYTTVIDCTDVRRVSRFWAEALGWAVAYEAEDEIVLVPQHALTADQRGVPPLERGPGLVFVPVPEPKTVKNRLHIDLAPLADDDHAAEVERLVGLGATRADVGQHDVSWVVLADPEGNEFCVLTPRN
jgi:predicted enzyme related to lactoylglutathione lyase